MTGKIIRGLLQEEANILEIARFNGFIRIFDLISLMKADDKCDEPIDKLLRVFDLPGVYKNYGLPGFGWYDIWSVFAGGKQTTGNKKYPFSQLTPNMGESIIPIRQYEKIDGAFSPTTQINTFGNYVKIDEVQRYFNKIRDVFGIQIPLPTLLVKDASQTDIELELSAANDYRDDGNASSGGLSHEIKLRPNQIHRKEARRIAKKRWAEDSSITIADMINESEILNATRKANDDLYAEKTMRNWIKDLCPDRTPGRKPKKK